MTDEKAYTVAEFLQKFKVGRTVAYEEMASGRLRSYKLGKSRRISSRAADDWQRQLEAETLPTTPEPGAAPVSKPPKPRRAAAAA
jgi:hypothetical protein